MTDFTESAEAFARDVAEHKLTVLHDEGLYRHLRFARPNTGINHFDLVTWPGHLSISGDMDGYVFARVPDMFEFFRAKSGWNHNTINPGYWAQKLVTKVPVRQYSEQVFREWLEDTIAGATDDWPGLKAYAAHEIRDADLDDVFGHEDSARQWLRDFTFVVPKVAPVREFGLADQWEVDFTDWDWHFLRACHAIQWGIQRYDAARVAEAALVAS